MTGQAWNWAGALIIGGAAAAAIGLAWWEITRSYNLIDWWHAEATCQRERADTAEAEVQRLRRELAAVRRPSWARDQLPDVMARHRVTDGRWGRAS